MGKTPQPGLYPSAAFGTSESQIKAPKDPSGERSADPSSLDVLGPVVHYAAVAGGRAN